MKVVCTQENLKIGLLAVGRIISPNNSLPILNNILLKTENGQLTLSSTNLEIAITTQIRCKIEEEGGITVFSKTITDLINNLPNKNIILENTEQNLQINTENFKTTIKTLPIEDFPLIPQIENNQKLTINSQLFKKSLDQVIFATSNNQTQPEISGVLLLINKLQLTVTATDRYRLSEKTINTQKSIDEQTQVIIPHKTIQELSRIIGVVNEDMEIVIGDTQISFLVGQTNLISRLIEGQYPDYKQIIPEKFSTTIVTEKQPLINALKTGGIFSQNNNSISINYDSEKQKLILTSESQDLGKSVVDLPSKIEGVGGFLTLNHKYILDCLSVIDSKNIIFKITNENSPTLILPEEQNNYMYLVMPIKG